MSPEPYENFFSNKCYGLAMQITAQRLASTAAPTPPPQRPVEDFVPTVTDRFIASLSEGASSGGTAALTGAVGAHLGMATMVRLMGAPWSGALSWVDPAVITAGAVAGGAVGLVAGAIHGAAKGEFSFNPLASSALGATVGAGAGALTFISLMNHATSGAAYFG